MKKRIMTLAALMLFAAVPAVPQVLDRVGDGAERGVSDDTPIEVSVQDSRNGRYVLVSSGAVLLTGFGLAMLRARRRKGEWED